uniref:SPK domain-containing protein n=1 Tax=Caenorhabditis japonica TaxID=281687 RepID=A0A8R1IRZ6_CAEJA
MTFCEENIRILNFLVTKVSNVDNPLLNMREVLREFRVETNSKRSLERLEERFAKIVAPKIFKIDELDFETKLKLIFATHTPLTKDCREILTYAAEVLEVDHRGIITKYVGRNGFELDVNKKSDQPRPPEWHDQKKTKVKKKSLDLQMLEFFAEKAKESLGRPVDMFLVWCDFKTATGIEKEAQELHDRFRFKLAPKMYKSKKIDVNTRIMMVSAAQTTVSTRFMNKMKLQTKAQ